MVTPKIEFISASLSPGGYSVQARFRLENKKVKHWAVRIGDLESIKDLPQRGFETSAAKYAHYMIDSIFKAKGWVDKDHIYTRVEIKVLCVQTLRAMCACLGGVDKQQHKHASLQAEKRVVRWVDAALQQGLTIDRIRELVDKTLVQHVMKV